MVGVDLESHLKVIHRLLEASTVCVPENEREVSVFKKKGARFELVMVYVQCSPGDETLDIPWIYAQRLVETLECLRMATVPEMIDSICNASEGPFRSLHLTQLNRVFLFRKPFPEEKRKKNITQFFFF